MDGGDDDDEHQGSAGVTLCTSRDFSISWAKKNSQISHRGVFPSHAFSAPNFPAFLGAGANSFVSNRNFPLIWEEIGGDSLRATDLSGSMDSLSVREMQRLKRCVTGLINPRWSSTELGKYSNQNRAGCWMMQGKHADRRIVILICARWCCLGDSGSSWVKFNCVLGNRINF